MEQTTVVRYMIACPCMESIPTATVASIASMKRVGAFKYSFLANSLVYDARNMLAAEALDTKADRILWLDSDMTFSSDIMERMAQRLDEGIDFVSGLYFMRKTPTRPCIYKSVKITDGKGHAIVYMDYPRDKMFEIGGCGFGAVMMTRKLLKDVYDTYDRPFDPMPGVLGEDLAFCWRAQQCGYKLWCDASIKFGHVGNYIYEEQHYWTQNP